MRKLGMNFRAERPKDKTDEEILARMKEYGFGAIFTGMPEPDRLAELAPKVREAGLDYDFIHAPFKGINTIWEEGEEGEEMLNRLLATVDGCAKNEIPIVVIHLSSGVGAPMINDLGVERFDRLIRHAGTVGVKVAMENQRKIGNIAALMERYTAEQHVGFCWDNGHEACFTPGREYMPLFGDRLLCLHIHDNRCLYNVDEHYLPFDGLIDFRRVADHIRASGYRGSVMLETKGRGKGFYTGLTEEEFLERAYMQANRLRVLIDGE
ncbi:MAG: sugar phosphate isomerase/epimerase [Clostridia bacterium]|nr:sugar phosphate isomerase/epimerase [Clostridia bacterium]